jgi:putative transposase
MTSNSTTACLPQSETETAVHLFDSWFDPIEAGLRDRVREFLHVMFEVTLHLAPHPAHRVLANRATKQGSERTAHATRVGAGEIGARDQCIGGQRAPLISPQRLALPLSRFAVQGVQSRARHRELHPAKAPHEGPRPVAVAVAAGAGALATAVRSVQTPAAVTRPRQQNVELAWDAWNARSLAEEPIVRLILDGTVVRVRLDRKATSISLLVVIGVRADGQKVLLALKSMGGESTEAWRAVLDDLIKRGLRRPEFLIVDGAAGLCTGLFSSSIAASIVMRAPSVGSDCSGDISLVPTA